MLQNVWSLCGEFQPRGPSPPFLLSPFSFTSRVCHKTGIELGGTQNINMELKWIHIGHLILRFFPCFIFSHSVNTS